MSAGEGEMVVWRRKSGSEAMDHRKLGAGCCSDDDDCAVVKNGEKKAAPGSPKKARRYALVSFWELPEYMKDNEFILHHYRANWPLAEAALSLFRWHNETVNVWTHLIGFLVFLGLTVANFVDVPQVADLLGLFSRSNSTSAGNNISYSKELLLGTNSLLNLNQITEEDLKIASLQPAATRWPFFVFLGGSMFCLLSSSICHLFSCHSHCLNIQLLRMDYVGITVMIITSFFPPIYYIFQCEPHWQLIYLSGITAMGMFTVATLLAPSLSSGKFRAFRAMLFLSMGFFGIVPAIHACIVNWSNPQRPITLAYELAMALSYITGTLFYVSRIPERLKPGWFDLAGHSHQIFHVFVIMGALAHYGATLLLLQWRDRVGCDRTV
ncbi:heptahelical transmembrane protein 1-like [Syzygium oleosum]|uniref:heptahelical transmembrane protein 1-like n=1 Tax=Syzygium oleosum TaxID=219896 RepID=UPI0024BB942A|nr:heptahelical transmembrane protein 1-like [Syzygium oleosum]